MAHLDVGQMKTMVSKELITGSDIPGTGKLSFCDACAEGKAHIAPFKQLRKIQSTRKLQLVNSDVAGVRCRVFNTEVHHFLSNQNRR